MNKEEFIKRYGKAAYTKQQEQTRKWQEAHPDRVKANGQEQCRKGGKGYEKKLKYDHTGLQGERNKIRALHAINWRPYKRIIAPDSVLHHQWRPGTAEYDGVAPVEKDQHQYGIIDVIQILDGKINVLTEEELQRGLEQ